MQEHGGKIVDHYLAGRPLAVLRRIRQRSDCRFRAGDRELVASYAIEQGSLHALGAPARGDNSSFGHAVNLSEGFRPPSFSLPDLRLQAKSAKKTGIPRI